MFAKRTLIAIGSIVLVGIVALVGLMATASSAAAQAGTTTGDTNRVRLIGKIASISGNTFTLDTHRGGVQVEVTTSDSTRFSVKNGAERTAGTLADLAAGDGVAVVGTSSGTNKVDAKIVAEGTLADLRRAKARLTVARKEATVTLISGTTLNVTGKNGEHEFAVQTDSATVFVKDGFTTLGSIAVGDTVHVLPSRGGQAAAAVIVTDENSAVAAGVVQQVNDGTLTVKTRKGVQTINTSNTTGYKKIVSRQVSDAVSNDIAVGSKIMVYGEQVAGQELTIDAEAILILPAKITVP